MSAVKKLWQSLSSKPGGKWVFTKVISMKAPYFTSIKARFERLEVGGAEITLWDKRSMHNHIGTVHAIAMCNAAELAAGISAEYSVPSDVRWIPKGMSVKYLKPAKGLLKVVGSLPPIQSGVAADVPVSVTITDKQGDTVFTAEITMYCSPKKPKTA
ncbi:hotdog fold domain-containing protein [Litorivivens sp.]|uniref:hotdog fold domain-containing protein n=1 Tax=Litorivivens sp. TaxID=2020868 RepID=UPI003568D0A8